MRLRRATAQPAWSPVSPSSLTRARLGYRPT